MLTGDPDAAARYLDQGFTFVAVGSDVGVFSQGAQKLAGTFRRLVSRPRLHSHDHDGHSHDHR